MDNQKMKKGLWFSKTDPIMKEELSKANFKAKAN